MGHIKTHALTNALFVMHPWKLPIKCGIHHSPETTQVKMACDVNHLYQFIPVQACLRKYGSSILKIRIVGFLVFEVVVFHVLIFVVSVLRGPVFRGLGFYFRGSSLGFRLPQKSIFQVMFDCILYIVILVSIERREMSII